MWSKLILSLIFISNTVFCQELDCSRFRTWIFLSSSGNLKTKIIRDHEFQIEEYSPLGIVIRMKVHWINSCTYKLEFIEGNKAWYDNYGYNNDEDMIIKIIETGDIYYIQESYFTESKIKPYRSRILKVEEIDKVPD